MRQERKKIQEELTEKGELNRRDRQGVKYLHTARTRGQKRKQCSIVSTWEHKAHLSDLTLYPQVFKAYRTLIAQ